MGEEAFGGNGRYEEFDVSATPILPGKDRPMAADFTVSVLSPHSRGPFPVAITETFCRP